MDKVYFNSIFSTPFKQSDEKSQTGRIEFVLPCHPRACQQFWSP